MNPLPNSGSSGRAGSSMPHFLFVAARRSTRRHAAAVSRIDDAQPQVCDHVLMHFHILEEVTHIETFASGSGIREIARLRKLYGKGRWRKRNGVARIRLDDGSIHLA